MPSNLKIEIKDLEEGQNYQIVLFEGDFDKAGHSDIRENLDQLIKTFAGKFLVFDFAKLNFINSESIGYLMEIHSYLTEKDQKLVLLNLRTNIEDIFDAIGMKEIVDIYTNLEEFLKK